MKCQILFSGKKNNKKMLSISRLLNSPDIGKGNGLFPVSLDGRYWENESESTKKKKKRLRLS